MTETVYLLLAFSGGLGLGGLFFGGLRWTVLRGLSSPRPAVWFFVSYLVRMALTMLGFYVISGSHWSRLVAGLFGFVIVRSIMTRLEGSNTSVTPLRESRHAIEP